MLDAEYSPGEAGAYNPARTPYLGGIWEAMQDDRTREITFLKPTQIGGTQGCTVVPIAFFIAEDPGPGMLVMPTAEDAREMKDRIDATLRESPNLRQFLPTDKGDDLRTQARYGGTTVYFRGGNSPRQTARVACKWVAIDETDKTARSTAGGRETGTIQSVRHRVRTVARSKIIKNGTPSVRSAPMWKEWEKSDQRRYHVPCPHCGTYQVLEFAQVRWPEGATADDVERDKSATYHCTECKAAIDPHREKAGMIARGVWVAKGGRVLPNGTVVDEKRTEHAGFHLNALYSPWLTWSQIAAEHLRAVTVEDRQDFTNGYLGWIFEEQVDRIDAEALRAKAGGYLSGTIPDGVLVLTVGVDCGARDLHYEVRGWGNAGETWLIEAGRIGSTDLKAALLEFEERVLKRPWARGETVLGIRRCFIDSGYKPRTVARFCRTRTVCKAIVGKDENPGRLIVKAGTIEKTIAGQVMGFPVLHVDVNETQDQVADTMHSPRWHVPDDVPPEWFRHLAAEHAVMIKGKKRWHPLPGAGPNHWGDACRYSFAAAYTLGAWSLRDGFVPARKTVEAAPAKAKEDQGTPAAPKPFVLPMGPPGMPGARSRGMQRGGFSSRGGFRAPR